MKLLGSQPNSCTFSSKVTTSLRRYRQSMSRYSSCNKMSFKNSSNLEASGLRSGVSFFNKALCILKHLPSSTPKIMAVFTHKWNIMKQLPQNHGNVQVIFCCTKRCFFTQNPRSLKFLRLEVGMLWSTVAKVQSVLRTWQGQKKFEGIRRFWDFCHINIT